MFDILTEELVDGGELGVVPAGHEPQAAHLEAHHGTCINLLTI